MTKKRFRAYVFLLLVSLIWGAASPVVKYALQWFDPLTFLTYRFAISALTALGIFALWPVSVPKKSGVRTLIAITMMLSAPLAIGLFFFALDKTSALSGGLLTAGEPLFIVLGGVLMFRDVISPIEKLGIVITLLGTVIAALGPLVFNHTANQLGSVEGNLIMILAVMSDMFAALLTKLALKKHVSASLLAHGQFIFAFLLFVPILLIRIPLLTVFGELVNAPLPAHLAVLFMALASGSLAYYLRNVATDAIEVSEMALFYYLQPVWAAILAVLWLHESITTSYIVGAVVITMGVMIAEYRRRARR